MKKFEVQVKRTEYGIVEVEAETIGEAIEKAEEAMLKGMCHWGNEETEYEPVEVVDGKSI